ncbi:MAG: GlcG/HbpS family heme-binding protein [Rhodopila sp.]
MLTLSKSKKIIDGAIQRARQLDARISVAVCGRNGRLIAFSRMDGCVGWEVDRSALGVATAAAIIGCPSDQLSDRYTSGLRISSFANVVPPRGQRGGLPIVEEGVIEGGCGVSGAATAEESEECTRAGIAALKSASTSGQSESIQMSKDTLEHSGTLPLRHEEQRLLFVCPSARPGVQAGRGSQGSETQRN